MVCEINVCIFLSNITAVSGFQLGTYQFMLENRIILLQNVKSNIILKNGT